MPKKAPPRQTSGRAPRTSLDANDVLSLLDDEERTELCAQLGLAVELTAMTFNAFSPLRLLQEVVKLRLPFVQMASDISSFLCQLEARIAGNVRFIVLPALAADLRIDFGPQMRAVVATALNDNLLVDHAQIIGERTAELERQARLLCDRVRAMPVDRFIGPGQVLDERARSGSGAQAFRDRWMADRYKRRVHEVHPADRQGLRAVAEQLAGLESLVARLVESNTAISPVVQDLQRRVARVTEEVRRKALSGQVALGYPLPMRSALESHFAPTQRCVNELREAVLAASDYVESVGDLFDFMNLDLWRQRWRLYELWIVARMSHTLIRHGASVTNTSRIVDGLWTLRFSKDSAPVLSFDLYGHTIHMFYQLYQGRQSTGDMPDVALQLLDGRFLAIVDPKHGYSYSRRDLNDVCQRYANAFKPYLSCVCNYFPVRHTETVRNNPGALVLYGLQPTNPGAVAAFEGAIERALHDAWTDLGLPAPNQTLVVLFDGSQSTHNCRDELWQRFRSEMATLVAQPRADSRALIFGDTILRQGTLSQLHDKSLLTDLPSSGTDFHASIRAALQHLAERPSPKQLWVFTDGAGLGNVIDLASELNATGVQILFVEIGGSHLRQLAAVTQARYFSREES